MPYIITHFGDVPLPDRMPEDDLDSGEVESTLLDSVGGVFDYYGDRQRLPRRDTIEHKGKYVGEMTYLVTANNGLFFVDHDGNFLIAGDGPTMLRSRIDALKAKIGQVDRLYRTNKATWEQQWKRARLISVHHRQTVEHGIYVAELSAIFETQQAGWRRAHSNNYDTFIPSASGTKGINVENPGQFAVEDLIIELEGGTGGLSGVRIQSPEQGIDLLYSGSIASGQIVTIDCGAQTVRRGNTDLYANLSFGSVHTARGWCPLSPGINVLLVTPSGSSGSIRFNFDEQNP